MVANDEVMNVRGGGGRGAPSQIPGGNLLEISPQEADLFRGSALLAVVMYWVAPRIGFQFPRRRPYPPGEMRQ